MSKFRNLTRVLVLYSVIHAIMAVYCAIVCQWVSVLMFVLAIGVYAYQSYKSTVDAK